VACGRITFGLDGVSEDAAARVRRLSVSEYVGTRRLSVQRQPKASSGAMLDVGIDLSTERKTAVKKSATPDFAGTVTVGVDVATKVSEAARACGSVLGTAVQGDDAFIRVRVRGASYEPFIAMLDELTGKDYSLSRGDGTGLTGLCAVCSPVWYVF
jgi:hypothetical protein